MPGKSHGPRSLGATVHRAAKSQTQLSNFTIREILRNKKKSKSQVHNYKQGPSPGSKVKSQLLTDYQLIIQCVNIDRFLKVMASQYTRRIFFRDAKAERIVGKKTVIKGL